MAGESSGEAAVSLDAGSNSAGARTSIEGRRLALFVPSLEGGGAERVMVNLAAGFAGRGFATDLVLARATGPYLTHVHRQFGWSI